MFLSNIGEKPKFARGGLSSITARGFSSVPPIKQNEYSFYIKAFLMIIFAGTLPLGCIFFFIDYFKFRSSGSIPSPEIAVSEIPGGRSIGARPKEPPSPCDLFCRASSKEGARNSGKSPSETIPKPPCPKRRSRRCL